MIGTKEDLIEVLENLAKKLDNGEYSQILEEKDYFCSIININEILENEIFPDFIQCYFINNETKEKYLLSVETYHGIGGSLKKIG
ncbi:MAG: hypothetical protein MJ176_00865 [Treponema sp.]|nr:hypothetical protein [Treponema sp.]